MDLIETLSCLFVATFIAFIACRVFGYCICFSESFRSGKSVDWNFPGFGAPTGKMHFNDPLIRVSRVGTTDYPYPYSTNLRMQT